MKHEDANKLQAFFPINDHEFLRGFTYITEGAITQRLDDVDPSWSFEVTSITNRDGQITAVGHMTVCGVTRGNAGMAKAMTSKDGYETNEPEKSAVTDALKRCARLFGIGRYLLDLPSSVKDSASLAAWFKQNTPTIVPQSPPARQNEPQAVTTSTAPETGLLKDNWVLFYTQVTPLLNHPRHAQNLVKLMVEANELIPSQHSVAQALELVVKHEQAKQEMQS